MKLKFPGSTGEFCFKDLIIYLVLLRIVQEFDMMRYNNFSTVQINHKMNGPKYNLQDPGVVEYCNKDPLLNLLLFQLRNFIASLDNLQPANTILCFYLLVSQGK